MKGQKISLLNFSCVILIFVVYSQCDNSNPYLNETTGSPEEDYFSLCMETTCDSGFETTKDCVSLQLFVDDKFKEPSDSYFFQFNDMMYVQVVVPKFPPHYVNVTLSYVYMNFPTRNVPIFDIGKESLLEVRQADTDYESIIRGKIHFLYEDFEPYIDGRRHQIFYDFQVGVDRVVRSNHVLLVAEKCEQEGRIVATPGTYSEFPCNETELDKNYTGKAVVLRYCDTYGWNDEKSKKYCRPLQRGVQRYQGPPVQVSEKKVLTVGFAVGASLLFLVGFIAVMIKYHREEYDDEDSSEFSKSSMISKDNECAYPIETGTVIITSKFANNYHSDSKSPRKRSPRHRESAEHQIIVLPADGISPAHLRKQMLVQELTNIGELKKQGVLTQKEFEATKKIILYE